MTPGDRRRATIDGVPAQVRAAIEAARDKKALGLTVLDLRKSGAFTDYFVICSGQSQRQVTAIADAVQEALQRQHVRASHVEGYGVAGWVLLDYFDFIVHVFTPESRMFYALERLWGNAVEIALPDAEGAERRARS